MSRSLLVANEKPMHGREDSMATGAGRQGGHGEAQFLGPAAHQKPLGSSDSPQG